MAAIACILVVALPAGASAAVEPAEVTAASVLEERATLDGKAVTFEGEAIGELLHADGGGVWLCVLGDGTALSVYLPAEMAARVSVFGDYGHTGDTVRVTGEFHRACAQHGGDLDVHATSLAVVEPGSATAHVPQTWEAVLAAGGFGVAGGAALVARRRRRRREGD